MFQTHGEHNVKFDNNILTVHAKGPFNTKQIAIYQKKIESELQGISGPWAQLNILYEDCLFTPEGEKALYASLKIRKDIGISAIANIFVEGSYTFIAEQQLSRMYALHDIPYACFDEIETATIWLREQVNKASKI